MVGTTLREKKVWMECCQRLFEESADASEFSLPSSSWMPVLRRYMRKIAAAEELYRHEQEAASSQGGRQSGRGSAPATAVFSIVERAREMVVESHPSHRMTRAELHRHGLSVADKFYGRATSVQVRCVLFVGLLLFELWCAFSLF